MKISSPLLLVLAVGVAFAASEYSLVPEPYLAPRYLAPIDAPSDIVIANSDEPGERLVVTGNVLDGTRPVSNASLFVFHTDAEGRYAIDLNNFDGELNPRLNGLIRTDDQGSYRFQTIRPGSYDNNAAHVHYVIRVDGYLPRLVDLWFDDDPILASRRSRGENDVPSAIYDSTVCRSQPDCVVISEVQRDANGSWHASRDVQMFRSQP